MYASRVDGYVGCAATCAAYCSSMARAETVPTEATMAKDGVAGADLSCLDLSGLDLSHYDLSHCDLSQCSLDGTNLSGANLSGATITGAKMGTVTGIWSTKGEMVR